jgi:hypothetical protein
MNYKIKITKETLEVVRRIANENGMNKKTNFSFWINKYYYIKNDKFIGIYDDSNFKEITTEQFIELFDKKPIKVFSNGEEIGTVKDLNGSILEPIETEFNPKRGDRVLVWDFNEDNVLERIFLGEIKGSEYPIHIVQQSHEKKFINGGIFKTAEYKHMKPIPTIEVKDFKTKVLELLLKRNDELFGSIVRLTAKQDEVKYLLKQIKELK